MIDDFLTNGANLTSSVSVVAADFDNDMDLDLMLSCAGAAINYPNKYYQNNGNGKFVEILNFGATGSKLGRSGALTTSAKRIAPSHTGGPTSTKTISSAGTTI